MLERHGANGSSDSEVEREHALHVVWQAKPAPTEQIKLESMVRLAAPAMSRVPFSRDGIYHVPGAMTVRDHVIGVLHTAAQIEHAVLIEYLYAAASLSDPDSSAVVTSIAIEEMGHLLTVQNILLAIGAHPYLRRQDQSEEDPHNPFPFRLQPANRDVIACYVAAESPQPSKLGIFERLELSEIKRVARAHIESTLMGHPGDVGPHRLGILYDDLINLFSNSDAIQLCSGISMTCSYQASSDEAWAHAGDQRSLIVEQIGSVEHVVKALRSVAAQGEGFEHAQNSHFHRFRALYRGMKRMRWIPARLAYEPSVQPVKRLRWIWRELGVFDPALQTAEPPLPSEPCFQQIAALLNIRYQIALLTIHEVLRRTRAHEVRPALIRLFMREMSLILPPLAAASLRQGSNAVGPSIYALPEGMPAATEAARVAQMYEAMEASEQLCRQLLSDPRPSYLSNVAETIRACDAKRVQLLDQKSYV